MRLELFMGEYMFQQESMTGFYNDELLEDKICPRCSMTRSDFLRSGVLGCTKCYEIFKKEVQAHLLQKQGGFNHIGKISSKHFSKIKIKEANASFFTYYSLINYAIIIK